MIWKKVKITLDNGESAYAQAPYIISASRVTDIPAFYMDWFMERLKKGYSAWKNPFSVWQTYVSFENLSMIVFWSKNPKPLLQYVDQLEDYHFYVQYTLNDYVQDGFEKALPPLEERIETFKQLVEKIGIGRVIWRFDPLVLTDKLTIEELLKRIKNIGDQLVGYTEKLVFSFVDLANNNKIKNNLHRKGILAREFTADEMLKFAEGLTELNKAWGYELGTCCEKIALEDFGIQHNKCIDDDLIVRLFPEDTKLRKLLGIEILPPDMFSNVPQVIKTRSLKDKGQRQFCGCIASKDIGRKDTCPHLCEYCYANDTGELVLENYRRYQLNKTAASIGGE